MSNTMALRIESDDVTDIFRSLRQGDCEAAASTLQRVIDSPFQRHGTRELFEQAKFNAHSGLHAVCGATK